MFICSSQEGTGSKKGLELRLELGKLYKSIRGNCEVAREEGEGGRRGKEGGGKGEGRGKREGRGQEGQFWAKDILSPGRAVATEGRGQQTENPEN